MYVKPLVLTLRLTIVDFGDKTRDFYTNSAHLKALHVIAFVCAGQSLHFHFENEDNCIEQTELFDVRSS